MKRKIKLIALSLCTYASILSAEDTVFTTHTELGYVSTQGNTNTKSGSLDFVGKQKWDKNAVQLDIDYLYGEENGIENNNKLLVEFNYDYFFTEVFAFNYLIGYKDDKFSGFDYQFYTGPGLKYIAIKNDAHDLVFQGNILYSKDVKTPKYYLDATKAEEIKYPYPTGLTGAYRDPFSGESDSYWSYLLKADYKWKITKSFKFIQNLRYRSEFSNSDNYFVQSKTGVESKISDIFSMGISYKVDYVNLPPEGNKHTDKTFSVTLIIDY